MCVANSVAYARDLKELHVARIEATEELRLHKVFMEHQRLAIQEEQMRLTQQLVKSAQLEAKLSERDTRLMKQERRLEEALEALRLEKQDFQAEREAFKHAFQFREAPAVGVDERRKEPIPAPTAVTLNTNGTHQHSSRFESNAESTGKFDGVGHSTGPNYNHQEGYSGHSHGYVQDSVYVGKSHDRANVHVPMSQQQQGVDRQDIFIASTPGLPTGRQF